MKIYLPFVLVLLFFIIKLFTICYAVVNLLIRTQRQLDEMGIFKPDLILRFGGLKWTRTIDLTLIRRVL